MKRRAVNRAHRPFRVLLIEDNVDHAELLTECLQSHAAPVAIDRAESLEDGSGLTARNTYDLIVFDLFLGNRSMIGRLGAMRRQTGATPLVVLAGSGDEALAAEVIKRGATEYIVKNRAAMERLPALFRFYRKASRQQRPAPIAKTPSSPAHWVARQMLRTMRQVESLTKRLQPLTRAGKRTHVAAILKQLHHLRAAAKKATA